MAQPRCLPYTGLCTRWFVVQLGMLFVPHLLQVFTPSLWRYDAEWHIGCRNADMYGHHCITPASSACNFPCAGNSAWICSGANVLNIYDWSGKGLTVGRSLPFRYPYNNTWFLCDICLTFLSKIQVKSSLLFILTVETRQFCKFLLLSHRLDFHIYNNTQIRPPTDPPTSTHPPNQHGRYDTILVYQQMCHRWLESHYGQECCTWIYWVFCLLIGSDDDDRRVRKPTCPFTDFAFGPSEWL